jgi:hypothetical protein
MSRRVGWAVILRCESGPRRGGRAGPGEFWGLWGWRPVPGREYAGAGQEALTGRRVVVG